MLRMFADNIESCLFEEHWRITQDYTSHQNKHIEEGKHMVLVKCFYYRMVKYCTFACFHTDMQ